MRYILKNLLICLFFILSACSQPNVVQLEQAEHFVMFEPEKAQQYLDKIENPKDLSKKQKMVYDLIHMEIKYKTEQEIISDTLMVEVVDYFKKAEDIPRLLRAYYCLGGIYSDLQDAPKAQKCFLEAIRFSDDYEMLYPSLFGRIYNHCGTLYLYQFLYNEALPLLKKALVCFEMAKEQTALSFIYRDIARAYHAIEMPDSSALYYQQAISNTGYQNSEDLKNGIFSEYIGLLLSEDKMETVDKLLTNNLISELKKDSISQRFLLLGHYFLSKMQLDSAVYYLGLSMNSESISTRREARFHLSHLEEKRDNIEKALYHSRIHERIQDTVSQMTQTKFIKQVHEMYNYERVETENKELKMNRRIFIYRIILASIIVVLILVFLYWIKRKRDKELKEQAIRREQLLTVKYKNAEQRLTESSKKIKDLEEEMTSHKDELDSSQIELYQTQKRLLEITENKYILQNEETSLLVQSFQHSTIYCKFQDAGKEDSIRVTKEDWAELQEIINKTYNDFTIRFKHYYPALTDIELQVCILVKSDLPITGIARILCRSKQMVSMCRSRLYKKMTGNTGSAEDLDAFINDF